MYGHRRGSARAWPASMRATEKREKSGAIMAVIVCAVASLLKYRESGREAWTKWLAKRPRSTRDGERKNDESDGLLKQEEMETDWRRRKEEEEGPQAQ